MPEPESNAEQVRARFGATASLVAEHAQRQIEVVREQARSFIAPSGDEHARGTAPGGRVFVDDQIASVDPLVALELDRFERARDPSHTRTLPDTDLRSLFDANELILQRTRFQTHTRELDYYLDLAGCEGEARERARALSPGGPEAYVAESGWYLLVKRS